MDDSFYEGLIKEVSSVRKLAGEFCPMDNYIAGEKVKVASLSDLLNFVRIGSDTLVHKAEKDLWRIGEDNGQVVIERLFDPSSNQPIRV